MIVTSEVPLIVRGLTRFERARMLGARALQISMGAPPLIETDATDPIEIAMEEFAKDLVPMTPTRLPYARH